MGTIAQRRAFRVFAATEIQSAVFIRGIRLRQEIGSLVGTIAKRLVGALATCTPEIFVTGFHLYGEWGFLGNVWTGHLARLRLLDA